MDARLIAAILLDDVTLVTAFHIAINISSSFIRSNVCSSLNIATQTKLYSFEYGLPISSIRM